ncbi:MAG: AMP-binding protein [Polyangiales bacterium]
MPLDPRRYADLATLLHDALLHHRDRIAAVECQRKTIRQQLSYAELAAQAARVAQWLAAQGAGPGAHVAILMPNQSAWLVAAYALFARGCVLVPIDYKLSAAEQWQLLQHAEVDCLICDALLWRALQSVGHDALPTALVHEAPAQLDVGQATRWEQLPAAVGPLVPVGRAREDVAAIVYSSGTGGTPKGCMLSHHNYLEQLRLLTAHFPMGPGDRYFSVLPTNHAIDFMCGFIGPLSGGATVVHQRSLRPEFVRHTLQTQGITHMAIVPLLLQAFVRQVQEKLAGQRPGVRRLLTAAQRLNAALTASGPRPALSRRLLAPIHQAFGGQLRYLFCGGAFVAPEAAAQMYALGLPVIIGYGLSEACTVVTLNDLKPFRADTVGRPLPGIEVQLRGRDPQTGAGEVWVRGPTVMQGYWRAPELSAEALQDGWLRTGDVGRFDAAGHLQLVGRRKNMVVTPGGKNIYPEDIEQALRSLDVPLAVFSSQYLWQTEALPGERLVAVLQVDEPVPAEALLTPLQALNRKLPEHKRISEVVAWTGEFPRTASMKLKRDALAQALRQAGLQSVAPVRRGAVWWRWGGASNRPAASAPASRPGAAAAGPNKGVLA